MTQYSTPDAGLALPVSNRLRRRDWRGAGCPSCQSTPNIVTRGGSD